MPDFDGHVVSTAQYEQAPALLVAFICRCTAFVRHIRSELRASHVNISLAV